MSKQNKPSPKNAVFSPFHGIETQMSHRGVPSAARIVNFRLTKDGSLIKREGCHTLVSDSKKVRAVWTGKLFGAFRTILLMDTAIVDFNTETGGSETIASIPRNKNKDAQFFFYRDRLYIIEENNFYELQENAATPIEPYIPLIGNDWGTTHAGEIYEPRNLLTRRARIHYLIPDNPSIFLPTAYSVESIESLYLNDLLISPTEYFYDETMHAIVLSGLKAQDRVRVCLTYVASSEGNHASNILSCCRANVFGDTQNNRVFLWNGNEKNIFYPSTYVSEQSLEASRAWDEKIVPLYFPEHSACILGDGRYDITGFVRQYDRLLIFTQEDTWMINTETLNTPDFSAKPINASVGCSTIDAYTVVDNAPLTVTANGLYRWTAETDEYSQCNAVCISEPIHSLLQKQFWENPRVFFSPKHQEIWLYSLSWSNEIWVYRLEDSAWYLFSGIDVEGFFEANGKIFTYLDTYISAFDEAYREDIDPSGAQHEIVAEFCSNILEYESSDPKRFSTFHMRADCDGGAITVSLTGDGLKPIECICSSDSTHSIFRHRLASGRFRYATLRITAGGKARQIIHSLISEVR